MTRAIILALTVALGVAVSACATEADPSGPPRMDAPDVEGTFGGEVLQRIRTGSYAYMEVRTPSGEQRWVVTLGEGAPEGSQVEVRAFGVRHDFESKRLSRTFDHLIFAIVHTKT